MRHAIMAFATVLIFATVAGAGIAFVMSPVWATPPSRWRWVAEIAWLGEDGTPIRVAVTERQRDAWTWLPERILGYIFVRRNPATGEIVALSEMTKYGTQVKYDNALRMFDDPCRPTWHFDLDGKCVADPVYSDLLKLDVQVRDGSVYIVHKLPRWGD